jgi:hypothetical protein
MVAVALAPVHEARVRAASSLTMSRWQGGFMGPGSLAQSPGAGAPSRYFAPASTRFFASSKHARLIRWFRFRLAVCSFAHWSSRWSYGGMALFSQALDRSCAAWGERLSSTADAAQTSILESLLLRNGQSGVYIGHRDWSHRNVWRHTDGHRRVARPPGAG